jgi:signal transduction histidine kinase/CheY-like chemotaxis protein
LDESNSPRFEGVRAPARRVTAALIFLPLAALLVGCWFLYRYEAGQIVQRETDRETLRVTLMTKLLQSELRPVADDVRLLADGDALRSFLETGAPEALRAATRRAKFMSERKSDYDQIRFIDQNGQEIIRLNRGGNAVDAAGLQNKSDRDYFLAANRLPSGALYLSAFDLNVENGRVEQPPKPTLRLAVPVFDSSGKRRGIYILNYLGDAFLTRLQEVLPTGAQRLRLLNASGYWLMGRNPQQEWGFMSPQGREFSLERSDPTLWEQILRSREGQYIDKGHVFSWQRLLPADVLGIDPEVLQAEDRFFVFASEMVPQDWPALLAGLRQLMLIVSAALVMLTIFCVWLFLRWREAMWGMRVANEELEQRVLARTAELGRSNQLLKAQEEFLEETGKLAKVGGWEIDPASGAGRWTDEIARIHDLDSSVEPSKEFGLQFYPGESRQRIEAAVQRSLADGTPYDLELEFVSALGKRKWVRTISRPVIEQGKVVRMRGALQDVTAQKITELKLQAQLQRLHLLEKITRAIGERQDLTSIFQVTIGAVETELPADFSCIGVYDAAAAALTVSAVAPASNSLAAALNLSADAKIPVDGDGMSRCVGGALVYESDITQLQAAFPQLLASGGLRSLVIAPLQIEGKVFGVLIAARRQASAFSSGECEFLRQLSEHVALAAHQARLHEDLQVAFENLRTTQQAVMQQERLKVLGQMASGIAHDINNAISPITLFAFSLLESEPGLSARTRAVLETIQRAANDVAETVARMREFYRGRDTESGLSTVHLNDLVQQAIELTRARWQTMPQQRGVVIELKTELAASSPRASGIESEIREALTNLIFNAVDAMPGGGTLTLRTRTTHDSAVVEVSDTGTGMDEETRRRCLEPFFTTKGEQGTGLGLAMVYGIMQRHHGTINIDSAPGQGTTLRLSFAQATASPEALPAPPVAPPTGLTLLVIDDDPHVLKALQMTLEFDGHKLLTATSGESGIATFLESLRDGHAGAISAVITDLGMPRMDGRGVAAAIKAASPQTPVILLTGWGERIIAEGAAPLNVDRVLSKPPRLTTIREALQSLLPGPPHPH